MLYTILNTLIDDLLMCLLVLCSLVLAACVGFLLLIAAILTSPILLPASAVAVLLVISHVLAHR